MHDTVVLLINRHGAVLSGSEQRWDGRVLGNATHGKLHPSMSERRRVPWRLLLTESEEMLLSGDCGGGRKR